MPDYETMYFHLFNRVTDAVRELEKQNYGNAKDILIKAQQEAEEDYLVADTDTELTKEKV